MKLAEIEPGQALVYWPARQSMGENAHYPAEVVAVTRTHVQVRVRTAEHPEGVVRSVRASQLGAHHELPV